MVLGSKDVYLHLAPPRRGFLCKETSRPASVHCWLGSDRQHCLIWGSINWPAWVSKFRAGSPSLLVYFTSKMFQTTGRKVEFCLLNVLLGTSTFMQYQPPRAIIKTFYIQVGTGWRTACQMPECGPRSSPLYRMLFL